MRGKITKYSLGSEEQALYATLKSLPCNLEEVNIIPCGPKGNRDGARYWCTPLNAYTFSSTGMDGNHFCIVKDRTDDFWKSPVYMIAPMDMGDNEYISIVAENLTTFFSIVTATGSTEILFNIALGKSAFIESCLEFEFDDNLLKTIKEVKKAFNVNEFGTIEDVYEYVSDLRKNADYSHLIYSKEYYEVIE